jgi:hypothetical protein
LKRKVTEKYSNVTWLPTVSSGSKIHLENKL